MSRLFKFGDDAFVSLLSWLDVGSICSLDTAVGNKAERLMWLHSLHTIDSKAIDKYEHCHLSIMWLIKRGARATIIRTRRSNRTSDRQITDMTFAGVGLLCTQNVDSVNQGFWRWLGMECDTSNGFDEAVFIRRHGLSQVTSIDLNHCHQISDIGVSAIAQGCPLLTSINLERCESISDVGVSAIAQGCPLLTLIRLDRCERISDIGLSAVAQGCPLLTSIALYNCGSISDLGVSAIAQGCPLLTSIDLRYCDRISYVGVSAIVQGCRLLTSMNLTGCDRLSETALSLLRFNNPQIEILRQCT